MTIINLTRKALSSAYYKRYENTPGLFQLYSSYSERTKWSRNKIREYQIQKLRQILIHARDTTVYYRELFSDHGFDPEKFEAFEQLEAIPVLTKDIVRKNFDNIISSTFNRDDRYLSITGGTSDITMRFYRNRECRSHRLAIQWRFDSWTGWKPHQNVAYIWPSFQDFVPVNGVKQKFLSKYITGVQSHFSGYLNDEECRRIVGEIREFKPTLIRCFPTPAAEIASYMIKNDIKLDGILGVVSTGEPLYLNDKKNIETAFGAPAYNLYATREAGTIAGQCGHNNNLHTAADSVLIEVVRDGRQLRAGEPGEILITDLRNTAMPLIRYAIKDHGELSDEKCPCGCNFPMMKNVIGRDYDSFIDADGRTVIALSLAMILIDEGPKVGQLQIIQNSLKDITVRICGKPSLDEVGKKFYVDGLKKLVKGTETVKFEFVNRIDREKSGKYRFTICNVDPDEIARLKRKA